MQDVSGVYTSKFLYTDGLKMALRSRKVSGASFCRVLVLMFVLYMPLNTVMLQLVACSALAGSLCIHV